MENSISQKNWYMVLIKGIIMILLAILVFASPEAALLTYALWIGFGFAIAGVVLIIQGISARKVLDNWGWTVFEGVIDVFFGYILMANPALTASILPFLVGFWAAFYGLFLIVDSFSGTGKGMMKFLGGILIFILANVVMFNPLMGGLTLAIWFAFILLIVGIYNVVISFSLK
jgi:uncharacterized membrane protein HdeD (DUF308 family)